jgi:transglutaminase-like putative cysteine protease
MNSNGAVKTNGAATVAAGGVARGRRFGRPHSPRPGAAVRTAPQRMPIDRLLQITFATLVALGTMLLGMGQRSLTLPLVTILAAGVSIYVTDLRGWIRLNRPVANLAALLAVVFSVSNFFHVTSEDQLLAVANLLVYLQVVLMFQRKTGRMYWQLLVLNVLQVVVGAALDLDMLFGLLLVVYLFVTLAAMNLLFIQREAERWQRMTGARAGGRGASKDRGPSPFARGLSPFAESAEQKGTVPLAPPYSPPFDSPSLDSPPYDSPSYVSAPGPKRQGPRTKNGIARSSAALTPCPAPRAPNPAAIRISTSFPTDPAAELLGPGIFRRTLATGMGTLVVAAVCFFSMPRFGRSIWAGGGSGHASTGYSPTVKLGDLGPLLQNKELVMRVRYQDEATKQDIIPKNPPLMRGSLVIKYSRGEWKNEFTDGGQSTLVPLMAPPGLQRLPLVRQRITLEPQREPVLFAVYPAFDANSEHVMFDPNGQQLVRPAELQGDTFKYELFTIGLTTAGQSRIIPQTTSMTSSELDSMLNMPDGVAESSPVVPGGAYDKVEPIDRLSGLRALASKTIRDAHLADGDRFGKAKALERMLSSPPFEYSLDRPPPAPGVDPIEDFVTRNHSGHCEYFASALALMLRSQGIPARMVIGYRGGEWDPDRSLFDVRQLHAHAWVEAYLEPGQIPTGERPRGISVRNGAWLVLDSTPASSAAASLAGDSWLSSFEDLNDYLSQLWNSYVVGLNTDRQDRLVYQPLVQAGDAIKKAWRAVEASAADLADRLKHYWIRSPAGAGEGFFIGPICLLLAIFAGAALGGYRLVRRLAGGKSKQSRNAAVNGVGPEIAFYRRFEAILARRGLVRRSGQTQLELAQAAAAALPNASNGPSAGLLARRVVDAYYRVRFGRRALDSRQAAAVEQLLDQLQTTVARQKSGPRRLRR